MLNFIGLLSLPDRISFNGGAKRQLGGEGQDGVSFFAILQCALGLDEANASQAQSFAATGANSLPVFSSHGVEAKVDDAEPTEGISEAPSPETLLEEGVAETGINPLLSLQVEEVASFLAQRPLADDGAAVSEKRCDGVSVEKAQKPSLLLFEDAAANFDDAEGIPLAGELSKCLEKNGFAETDEVETDKNDKGMFVPGDEEPRDKAGPSDDSTDGRVATRIEIASAVEAALEKEELAQGGSPQRGESFASDEKSAESATRHEPFEKKFGETKADFPLKALQETFKAHKNAPAEGLGARTNDGHPDLTNVNRSFAETFPHLAGRSHLPLGETTDLGRSGPLLPFSVDLEGEGIEAAGNGLGHAIRFIHQGNIDRAYVVVEPPEWGRIQIDLGLSRDGLEAFIRVENEELAASLRGQIEGLKTALESSGINLAHVAVEAKGGDMGRRSGDQLEERRRKKASDPHIGEEGVEGAIFQLDLDRGLLCWIA
ncbi:MAG TPA: flagellar hook-length control protein FliK [Synergistaceae bacterium]|nr:flagellar hook-length control protein FliK [Synergistaceae bacterium]